MQMPTLVRPFKIPALLRSRQRDIGKIDNPKSAIWVIRHQ